MIIDASIGGNATAQGLLLMEKRGGVWGNQDRSRSWPGVAGRI
jgi:hypothetical protein